MTDARKFNLLSHLHRQRAWSDATFGPGMRTKGLIEHIRKELIEIEENPSDVVEWIDVVILALEGAMRTGRSPSKVIDTLVSKQSINERRIWPASGNVALGQDQPTEHIRELT